VLLIVRKICTLLFIAHQKSRTSKERNLWLQENQATETRIHKIHRFGIATQFGICETDARWALKNVVPPRSLLNSRTRRFSNPKRAPCPLCSFRNLFRAQNKKKEKRKREEGAKGRCARLPAVSDEKSWNTPTVTCNILLREIISKYVPESLPSRVLRMPLPESSQRKVKEADEASSTCCFLHTRFVVDTEKNCLQKPHSWILDEAIDNAKKWPD